MSDDPSGERFIPESMGGDLIDAEHQARYRLAREHVTGARVLDAGCGVGWGSKLLLEGGAASVLGVDIDHGAIADARRRTPGAQFVQGDLTALALPADGFDVVVCFEALEHVDDAMACLDELVRVLHPDGLLFVSSPNPDVYPAGNPFHIRELRPDELVAEVGKRLAHTRLFRQHLLVSSLLQQDPVPAPSKALDVSTRPIGPLEPGHDPYSLVVAANVPLPEVRGIDMLAPSHQLDNLETLASALAAERAELQGERASFINQRDADAVELDARGQMIDELRGQLDSADAGLHRLTADNQRALDELAIVHAQVADLISVRLELERSIGELAQENAAVRHDAETRLAGVTRERDRFAAALVQAEQALARVTHDLEVALDELPPQIAELGRQLDAVQAELDATLGTVSWRVTRPLREVRRRSPRG